MSIFEQIGLELDDSDDMSVNAVLVAGGVRYPVRAVEFWGSVSTGVGGVEIDDSSYSVGIGLPRDVQVSPPGDRVEVAGGRWIIRRVRPHAFGRVFLDLVGPLPSDAV